MRINIFYGYSYLLQDKNYIVSRPTNKIFLQSVRKQTETDRKQKIGHTRYEYTRYARKSQQ